MFKSFIVSGLVAFAAAQSSVLTFTHVPNPVTDGEPQAITYSTNDTTTPVTILLRKGQSTDLQTVETLTSSATSGQYIWTPSKSLPNGDDYALEITQGNQINYYGPFVVQGAGPSATISSFAAGGASSSITVSANGTASTTVPLGTGMIGSVGTGSVATGTALPRNTTMSMATLSSSGSASATAGSPSTASASSTGSASTPSGSSSTTSAPASSSSKSGATQLGSALVLVFAAVAAVFYLQ